MPADNKAAFFALKSVANAKSLAASITVAREIRWGSRIAEEECVPGFLGRKFGAVDR